MLIAVPFSSGCLSAWPACLTMRPLGIKWGMFVGTDREGPKWPPSFVQRKNADWWSLHHAKVSKRYLNVEMREESLEGEKKRKRERERKREKE